ncbi:hypothetical protein N836_03370 [Leptolyngbya sp. Heron Island J]|uniref:hypothetical protein n=1 Tax=Leptolyngbya sp. Heron Island J TaxID=1385935 RepID=UPI0003B956B1|nr:hypothetical protein [Leptolyngbya sp. Heron Island J]ESA37358.1 hypothetical protein N836_03370 [Leptolyngbya sp. Heron Island J]
METTKVTISLNIQANSKFIARNEKVVREMVELIYFSKLGLRKEDIGGWIYQLTFKHTDEDDLKRQFSELLDNIWSTADGYYCFVESDVDEGPDYLLFC